MILMICIASSVSVALYGLNGRRQVPAPRSLLSKTGTHGRILIEAEKTGKNVCSVQVGCTLRLQYTQGLMVTKLGLEAGFEGGVRSGFIFVVLVPVVGHSWGEKAVCYLTFEPEKDCLWDQSG